MKRTKLWLAAFTGIALVGAVANPAGAHGGSVTITDIDNVGANRTLPGNDFDPACVVPDALAVPGYGCTVAANDGSSESTDLKSVKLEHTNGPDGTAGTADDRLKATITVDGHVPVPGDTQAAFDGPRDTPTPLWLGGTYMVMFNNIDQQVDRPTTNGGCARIGTGTVYDQQRHWADGYYKFLALQSTWNGTGWTLTPQIGNYSPTPDGGFGFVDLPNEPAMTQGNAAGDDWNFSVTAGADDVITVEVAGIVDHTDTDNCANGVRKEVFANHTPNTFSAAGYTGDKIDNVFGFSTSDQVVTLPVTVPLSITCDLTGGEVCEPDLEAIGGFVYYADNTHQSAGGDVFTPGITSFIQLSVDNLGDGPQCPTPTVGGTLPRNPIEAQNTGCQIDDDALGYPALAEFHKSGYGFTF